MNATPQPTEAEVRAMRDQIYGPGTDKNWDCCREHWMTPENIAWLIKKTQAVKP